MEALVEKLTNEIVELRIQNLKYQAEITLLRKHVDAMSGVFSKPIVVTLSDQQLDYIAQLAATYMKAATNDPNRMN